MKNQLSIIKGIHPGFILRREFKKRNLSQRQFAVSIGEHFQTINSITKGRRRMNTALSLKVEKALNFEEGYFMILQTYYDIKIEKSKQDVNYHPDFSKLSPALFWDTKMEKINWRKYRTSIIRRVLERGDNIEKAEIARFYGISKKGLANA